MNICLIYPRKRSMIISLTKFSVIVLVKTCRFFSGSSCCRSSGGISSSVASYQVSERKGPLQLSEDG